MVIYNGYCRPLKQKVDFEVAEVNSIETSRGVGGKLKEIMNLTKSQYLLRNQSFRFGF